MMPDWSVIANEIALEHRGEWSEAETSYGGGGVRVDRVTLAKQIAYALARAFEAAPDGRKVTACWNLALEEAAKVADNYARDGRVYQEYACETADEIAAHIRAIKSPDC